MTAAEERHQAAQKRLASAGAALDQASEQFDQAERAFEAAVEAHKIALRESMEAQAEALAELERDARSVFGRNDPAFQVGTCFLLDGAPRVVVAFGEEDDGPTIAHMPVGPVTWSRADDVMECPELEMENLR